MKTRVKFFKEPAPEGVRILAVFPDLLHDYTPNLTCYSNGYKGISLSYVIGYLKEASFEEYQELLIELEAIGYELEVIN